QLKIKNSKLKILLHEKNQGKGAAIRTALKHVTGEIVTIQDADLEYNPEEIGNLIVPIIEGKSQVVYGSRFLQLKEKSFMHYYLCNKLLNLLTNFIYGANITDMETCYKVFRSDVILSLNLTANRFEFEPEVTAKILKRKIPIYELPVSYKSRTYKEGKKIGWRDGVTA
ncbi:MAG: glycosyltransferase family 2 protein, partial [Elusimicrobiota bacterium]|nr:glycosyltransferase family 2 protein [Elusimicrobiota bacterium]